MSFLQNHVSGIVLFGSQKQMKRVYTTWVIAHMTNTHTIRNWAFSQNIRNAMGVGYPPSNIHFSIAKRGFRSPPFPTFNRRGYIGVPPKFHLRFNRNISYTKHRIFSSPAGVQPSIRRRVMFYPEIPVVVWACREGEDPPAGFSRRIGGSVLSRPRRGLKLGQVRVPSLIRRSILGRERFFRFARQPCFQHQLVQQPVRFVVREAFLRRQRHVANIEVHGDLLGHDHRTSRAAITINAPATAPVIANVPTVDHRIMCKSARNAPMRAKRAAPKPMTR